MLDFLSSSFLGESVSKFVHETGFAQLFLQEGGYKYLIMIAVGCFFLYLAIKHKSLCCWCRSVSVSSSAISRW